MMIFHAKELRDVLKIIVSEIDGGDGSAVTQPIIFIMLCSLSNGSKQDGVVLDVLEGIGMRLSPRRLVVAPELETRRRWRVLSFSTAAFHAYRRGTAACTVLHKKKGYLIPTGHDGAAMEHLGEKASGAPKVNPYTVIGGAGQQLRRPIPQRHNSAGFDRSGDKVTCGSVRGAASGRVMIVANFCSIMISLAMNFTLSGSDVSNLTFFRATIFPLFLSLALYTLLQGKSLSPAAGFWCAGALPSPPHGAKGRRKSTYSVSNFNASVSFHKEALALMTGSFLHRR
nr:hypothetical protein Iba_chr11aCG2920 [Ipomoea batatas]